MILNANCRVHVEATAAAPAMLMMRPISGAGQQVLASSVTIDPQTAMFDVTDLYGNCGQRLIVQQGISIIEASCRVEVADEIDVWAEAGFTPVNELPDAVMLYLLPSRFCQSDLMLKLATKIVRGASPGYGQVEAICRWIHRKIRYKYGSSSATTTALDTEKSRKGVCRDFAHLGIALCRAIRIPARMVSGYLYELDPMDLHLWFEAFIGGRWYTFDATQRSPKGGRIVLAYGRDVADIAWMSEYGPLRITMMEVSVEISASA